jgi:uncharacterized protein YbbC (DUF1343 family)
MSFAPRVTLGQRVGSAAGRRGRGTVLVTLGITSYVLLLSCASMKSPRQSHRPIVGTGLDVLAGQRYKLLQGKRVGLICNHSAVNLRGEHIISLFRSQRAFDLVALFSPEHGLKGGVDRRVASGVDRETGLKVYSLYGKMLRPTEESLKDIDTLVFDIQDIGARFYTYISTMAMCMEEAAKHRIKFVVLDRPNPITGTRIGGPLLHKEYEGRFISYFPLPVMHGMTVGELARMFNKEFNIGCDLRVLKMRGWRRSMWFDETGLPWIDPSPNIRNLVEATLYPGFAIVEFANISVGRGTSSPFELYGAPWIDGKRLTERMNKTGLAGLQFAHAEFTPIQSKFAGEKCSGVRVTLTDREKLDCLRAGLTFVEAIYRLHGDAFDIERIGPLIGDPTVAGRIKAGVPVEKIISDWQPRLRRFMKRREHYLLYP